MSAQKNGNNNSWSWVIVGVIGLWAYGQFTDNRQTSNHVSQSHRSESSSIAREHIARDDAISEHWDEIKEFVDGSETVEACSDSGCYDLEAEISSGIIETVHFANGGYLTVSAEIDENGSADDVDQRGRLWEFTLDMDAPIVDEALAAWAESNGKEID